jgi:hypothetical protein
MLIGALILGILGGIFGLGIGLFGYGLGAIAGATEASDGARLFQIVSIAIPMASIVGGGIAIAKPLVGGALMLISAVGMFFVFGFNFFTFIPLVLSGLGGGLALLALNEPRRQTR